MGATADIRMDQSLDRTLGPKVSFKIAHYPGRLRFWRLALAKVEWTYQLEAATSSQDFMSTQAHYPHLTIDADGVARIAATRYKVIHLAAEHYQHGWTAEELLRQHPDLHPEQVYAAVTYFYD